MGGYFVTRKYSSVCRSFVDERIMKDDNSQCTAEGKVKVKRKAPIKVVLRRLPRDMTWKELQIQLDPIPETEFTQFVAVNAEDGLEKCLRKDSKFANPRAYFVFKNDEDIETFRDRFSGYVFIDSKGSEGVGLVELAPNPKVSRNKVDDSKKRDRKCGTIDTDLEYKKFLDDRENASKITIVPIEERIKEVELKEKNAHENAIQETPLTQYLLRRSEEKYRRIQEKRRNREEERRLRLQRLYEKEQKERAERGDGKRVTEFRNSKFERAPFKEKYLDRERRDRERDRDRHRDKDRDRPREKDRDRNRNKDKDRRRDKDRERGVSGSKKDRDREDGSEERELTPSKKSERVCRNERTMARKERDDTQGGKENVARSERISKKQESKGVVDDNNAEAARSSSEKQENGNDVNEGAKVKSTVITPRTVMSRTKETTAEKSETKETEKSDSVAPKQPRRARDRPERAIYQPGALRRRAAALNAAAASSSAQNTESTKHSERASSTNPKSDLHES
ncbi:unnamed protein product [Anisakis simplex]|uniref:Smg4_UPF3 domain-containing protein n=1 Tax=Anisakis simplex TaxID=6269 RepID=A0A0M3JX29_ANISI|nr:unnamed protein product [Anisakis simplex]